MRMRGFFDASNQWDQRLTKQKTCLEQQFDKSEQHTKGVIIDSSGLVEVNLKNEGDFSYPRLVFSIEAGQAFWIGEEIQIIVLGSNESVVRLGIKVPPEVKILKDESQKE